VKPAAKATSVEPQRPDVARLEEMVRRPGSRRTAVLGSWLAIAAQPDMALWCRRA